MKKLLKLTALLAVAALAMTACKKDLSDIERDITYTVDETTTTVHLKTDAEFDALLDRFCDYAEEGHRLSFHSIKHTTKAKGSATKGASTITTTSRTEMKAWMRKMEDAGKTVTVTYNPSTGTYNGTAYATASQQEGCYTGILVNQVDNRYPPISQPTDVIALQVGEDCTMVIDSNGFFFNGDSLEVNGVVYHVGDTVTICGEVDTLTYDETVYYFLNIGETEPLWVDLGLPSGLLWASRNLGANHSGEHGELYSWGETQHKWSCSWSNYSHCVSQATDSISMHSLTKYCSLSSYGYNGYTDTLTVLLPEDDAATVQWGEGARTPTLEEWEELINNCTFSQLPKGVRVEGPNGNTIYFPGNEYYVSYMASNLLEEVPCWNTGAITYRNLRLEISPSYRYSSQHVRPVKENQE